MMNAMTMGILLVVAGGICEGLFSIGVTRTPRWKFENIWGLGSLLSLAWVPIMLYFVHDWIGVYSGVGTKVVMITFLCGVGWGLGGIFWGRAIAAVGMALGVSLLMGLINVFGSIGPMAYFESHKLMTRGGHTLMGAVGIMILGVVLTSIAGKLKEKELTSGGETQETSGPSTPFMIGLLFCVLSGVLSALVNFGFIYGKPISTIAEDTAKTPEWALGFGIWALVFAGNYLVNSVYAMVLMIKNKSAGLIFSAGKPSYWFWVVFMALAWPGGIAIYGYGAYKMGDYGPYVGFPMMLLVSILAGNAAGAITGEWKGTSSRPRMYMLAGVLVLALAFAVFGWAKMLLGG